MQVFVDSDVVISSLLSHTGAAYFLLHQSHIEPIISTFSQRELEIVVERLRLGQEELQVLIKNHIKILPITEEVKDVNREYEKYVIDINDAHIVAGAHYTNVKYLITYNLKHYKIDKIKDELDILLLTPALFLQYLRSQ